MGIMCRGTEQKEKRTHGPAQQCGDYRGIGEISRKNGNGKNTINKRTKKRKRIKTWILKFTSIIGISIEFAHKQNAPNCLDQ